MKIEIKNYYSYNKYKTHSLDKCAKNIIKNCGQSQNVQIMIRGQKNTLNAQPKNEFFFHGTFNTKKKNRMPKPVPLQQKLHLGFKRKKYHRFKIMEKMRPLQRTI